MVFERKDLLHANPVSVNHRLASPDKAQKQALAPLAWALTALAPVYRLHRLHTHTKI